MLQVGLGMNIFSGDQAGEAMNTANGAAGNDEAESTGAEVHCVQASPQTFLGIHLLARFACKICSK